MPSQTPRPEAERIEKQAEMHATLPPGARRLDTPPMAREKLLMALTSKMPDVYEDLDDDKKNKVEHVLANLHNGAVLRDACVASGMSDVTFYRMRKRYPWIQHAMDTIVESRLQIVEDALYRSATGYDYEVTEQHQEQTIDAQGNATSDMRRRAVKKKVHVQPNPTSVIFFLKNRARGHWRSDHHLHVDGNITERKELALEVEVRNLVKNMTTEDLRQIQDIGANLTKAAQRKIDKGA